MGIYFLETAFQAEKLFQFLQAHPILSSKWFSKWCFRSVQLSSFSSRIVDNYILIFYTVVKLKKYSSFISFKLHLMATKKKKKL